MIVKLQEIGDSHARYTFQIERKDVSKLEDRIVFDKVDCEAVLTRYEDFIDLSGSYSVRIEAPCDVCLEPFESVLQGTFNIDLVEEGSEAFPERDLEISLESPDIDFYKGDQIDLVRYFEDQLALDLPFTLKCSDNCKGICSACGANLNHETCKCNEDTGNSPFSILKELNKDPK